MSPHDDEAQGARTLQRVLEALSRAGVVVGDWELSQAWAEYVRGYTGRARVHTYSAEQAERIERALSAAGLTLARLPGPGPGGEKYPAAGYWAVSR